MLPRSANKSKIFKVCLYFCSVHIYFLLLMVKCNVTLMGKWISNVTKRSTITTDWDKGYCNNACRNWSAFRVTMFWPWYVSICCGVLANYIGDDNIHIWDHHSVPIFQQTLTSFLAELNIVVQMTWQILNYKCQVSWSIKLAGKNTMGWKNTIFKAPCYLCLY